MDRRYRYIWMTKKFLFKKFNKKRKEIEKPLNYTVYIMNDVIWYRLEPISPEIRFPEVVNMIMKKGEFLWKITV